MSDRDRIGCLTRLGLAKSSEVSDETLETYISLLTDVPDELLKGACIRLAKAATYGYPTVGDIRLMVDTVQREGIEVIKALPPALQDDEDRRRWVHCRECQDDPSAWLPPRWCQGSGKGFIAAVDSTLLISTCGRPQSHAPHSFTERCSCHMASWRQERRMQKFGEETRARA